MPIASPYVVSYLTSIVSNSVSQRVTRYLMLTSCDLDLERFKVSQSQRSRYQSIARGWFLIRFQLTPSSCLSPFLPYLSLNLFLIITMVKINSTSDVMDIRIPDFHRKQLGDHISRDTAILTSLVNLGERLRPVGLECSTGFVC